MKNEECSPGLCYRIAASACARLRHCGGPNSTASNREAHTSSTPTVDGIALARCRGRPFLVALAGQRAEAGSRRLLVTVERRADNQWPRSVRRRGALVGSYRPFCRIESAWDRCWRRTAPRSSLSYSTTSRPVAERVVARQLRLARSFCELDAAALGGRSTGALDRVQIRDGRVRPRLPAEYFRISSPSDDAARCRLGRSCRGRRAALSSLQSRAEDTPYAVDAPKNINEKLTSELNKQQKQSQHPSPPTTSRHIVEGSTASTFSAHE